MQSTPRPSVRSFAPAGFTVGLLVLATADPSWGQLFVPAGATIETEGCTNGAIDPGESVTVSLCLQSHSNLDTVQLMATLQATGGVTSPSGPEDYGVVVVNGPAVCREFSFTAEGMCRDTLTATLSLVDGMTGLGSVNFQFMLGSEVILLSESFDGVVAPALPAGWTATTLQDVANISTPWATTATNPDSPPNAVFTNAPIDISDEVLISPPIPIPSVGARLRFRHFYQLENGFDGGVLEISIGGGPFGDIFTAGGDFIQGIYNGMISGDFMSPIANRVAWSGSSGGYVDTVVDLPPSAAEQDVVLRFRRATDSGAGGNGWLIDDVVVTSADCCTCALTCPADIITDNDPNQCGAVVGLPAPTQAGMCGTVTCSPPSGFFPPGSNQEVICSEPGGASCSFAVTVNDVEAPVITCAANVFEGTSLPPLMVDYAAPGVMDNCLADTQVSCVPPSGSLFPADATTVTCTANDGTNQATCDFEVTVIQVEAPAVPMASRRGLVLLGLLLAAGAIVIARRMTT